MFRIACFCLFIAVATPLRSQVEPSATGGGNDLDSEHMRTPPPVSRDGYPATAGSEDRANFLSAGLIFTTAYIDNLMLFGNESTSDESYSILPSIGLDRRTPRHGESLRYSSGYTFYQNTNQLNSASQSASANFRYHLTRYAILSVNDSFQQNNNLYNRTDPFAGGGISGAPGGSSTGALIEPYANQLQNSSGAALEYQYSKNSMVGASGAYSFLNFSSDSGIIGLNDEDTAEGNAFYSRRFGRSYAGVTYQFSKFITHPVSTYTVSDTVFGFFTHYFNQSVSFSVLGGPERYTSWNEVDPKSSAWTPALQGNLGWHTNHTNLAANYSHVVSGAGGLLGTFHSDGGGLSGEWLMSPKWSIGVQTAYLHFKNLSSNNLFGVFPGGNTITGGFDVERKISERLSMQAGYQHLHQSYSNITASSSLQDSDRASVSIMYGISRPLGR